MTNEDHCAVKLPKKVYSMIEKAVSDLYQELEIAESPIRPFDIAAQKGYVVKRFSELPYEQFIQLIKNERDGISYFDPELGAFVICYDDTNPSSRIRFTIMHEIGHIILEHKQESELARKMADYFAAYALVPTPLIAFYECEDYLDVASRFDISAESAYYCFERYDKRVQFGGQIKQYEADLLRLYKKNTAKECDNNFQLQ